MKKCIKKLVEMFLQDEESGRRFTKFELVIYGILVPIVLVVIIGIAGWMETKCM